MEFLHPYGISAPVTQTAFCKDSSGNSEEGRLFSQANINGICFSVVAPIVFSLDNLLLTVTTRNATKLVKQN